MRGARESLRLEGAPASHAADGWALDAEQKTRGFGRGERRWYVPSYDRYGRCCFIHDARRPVIKVPLLRAPRFNATPAFTR